MRPLPSTATAAIGAVVLLLATTLLASNALADEDDAPLDLAVEHDISGHPQVSVTVTAPRPLVGVDVPPEAFTVEEDGEPREAAVSALSSEDLQIVLLVDTSGSMNAGDAMPATRAAAIDFVEAMPASTQIGVVEFHTDPEVVSPMSEDHDAHVDAIAELRPGGTTALYDAIGTALDELPEEEEEEEEGAQRAIVLLSDGGDTSSDATLDEATTSLADADATLYAIELVTNETDPEALQALADATDDGELASAEDTDALADVYDGIAGQLVDRYVIEYESEAFDETRLRVAVEHADVAAEAVETIALPAPPPEPEPEEEAAPPAPREGAVQSPGWLSSGEARIVGIVTLAAAFVLLMLAIFVPREARSQLAGAAGGGRSEGGQRIRGISELSTRATGMADRVLRRRGYAAGLNRALERAGINLRPGELVVLVACAAVTALALGWLLAGPVLGVVLAALTVLAARVTVSFKGSRRQAAFADQLGDTLQLLAGTLRAGYGLMQAIDSVAKESDSPTSEEYRRLVVETRLGRDVNDSMLAMRDRVGNEDFEWVIQSIAIHREVGGDLAEVLDTVAATIRERNQVRRQVKALSAEGKLSAIVLFGLPFAIGGFVSITNPGYLSPLVTDPMGWAMLAMGTVLLGVGGVWLMKTVQIKY